MTDQTLQPFERWLAAELDGYAAGVVDPTPTDRIAARAMEGGRRGTRPWEAPWFRLALVAALLVLALMAAFLVAGLRPGMGESLLTVGCGSDVACPEGEGVWITRPRDGADVQLFADVPVKMAHATWLPGGRGVIATDQRDLYVSDLEGSSRLIGPCVLPCLGQDDPAVSHDGSMLAWTVSTFPTYFLGDPPVDYTGTMQLVVAPLGPDGTLGTPRVVAETHASGETGANQLFGPRWSPDGRSLLFWEDRIDPDGRTTGAAVFTVGLAGDDLVQRTDWATYAGDADWSPDGTSIVYSTYPTAIVRPSEAGNSNLWLLPSDGGDARPLTGSKDPSYRSMQPRFRADGSIVYMVAKPGAPEIHVLDPVTMRDDTIMTGLFRTLPEWQPGP